MSQRRRLPKYCSEFKDRHGKARVRFRRTGQETHYFQAAPWTPGFLTEYQACLDRVAAPKITPGKGRSKPGTVDALIEAYYQTPDFTGLAAGTKPGYRSSIERFRAAHGSKRVALIERKHIKAILGAMSATPGAANNLYDRLRTLMALAVDEGMRKDNPMLGMKLPFKTGDVGYHSWTEEEIEQFEARHPVGTMPRLAMALMLFTGQRKSEAVRMGRHHLMSGRIRVRQQKTAAELEIPIHPLLKAALDAMTLAPIGGQAFVLTSFGKPFTAAGFGNWFRERCDEAGLPHCAAHGLRKAAARRLAEAGCTNAQIKAITGHKTDAEVSRYTRAAAQRGLADEAMKRVGGTRNGTEFGYPDVPVSQNEEASN